MSLAEDIERHVSPEWLAGRLDVGPQTVRKKIRDGLIAARKYGKLWRIPFSEAQRVVEEGWPESPMDTSDNEENLPNGSPDIASDGTEEAGVRAGRTRKQAAKVVSIYTRRRQ